MLITSHCDPGNYLAEVSIKFTCLTFTPFLLKLPDTFRGSAVNPEGRGRGVTALNKKHGAPARRGARCLPLFNMQQATGGEESGEI